MAEAARVERFEPGELILDAFTEPNSEVYVVIDGGVDVWQDRDRLAGGRRRAARPGRGVRVLLDAHRTVGRAAGGGSRCGRQCWPFRQPWSLPAFTSHRRRAVPRRARRRGGPPREPALDVQPGRRPDHERADRRPAGWNRVRGRPAADRSGVCRAPFVERGRGSYAIVSDALLRRQLIVEGRPAETPIGELVTTRAPTVRLGDSATEALIGLLETEAGVPARGRLGPAAVWGRRRHVTSWSRRRTTGRLDARAAAPGPPTWTS